MTAAPNVAGGAALSMLFEGWKVPVPPLQVTGLAMDSRHVAPGDLFLAVRGSTAHGLQHLEQAIGRGAVAIAWEPGSGIPEPEVELPRFPVERLGMRVGEIAARFYGKPSDALFVVGVTGTDGKSSTAHLLAQALDLAGQPCAYFGTLGFGRLAQLDGATHTTPDPISLQRRLAEARDGGCAAVAMEVSSHALDQNRVGGVAFDSVVLTNVTRDHLDYHRTVEAYAAAKRKLFEPDDGRLAILNRDDEHGARWLDDLLRRRSARERVLAYGVGGNAPANCRHLLARELELHRGGLRMRLATRCGEFGIDSPLLGRFNAYNLMAAAAVLLGRGLPVEQIADVLSRCRTVPGRIEGFRGPRVAPLVVVDYAHTPKALEQVLSALRAHCGGRLWCVFGCGGDRDRGKRPLMGLAAVELADEVIVTDDNPRSEAPEAIVAEILNGPSLQQRRHIRVQHDRARAIETAVYGAGADDIVLIAGKGHEESQIYSAETREFSDRAFVARLLGCEVRA